MVLTRKGSGRQSKKKKSKKKSADLDELIKVKAQSRALIGQLQQESLKHQLARINLAGSQLEANQVTDQLARLETNVRQSRALALTEQDLMVEKFNKQLETMRLENETLEEELEAKKKAFSDLQDTLRDSMEAKDKEIETLKVDMDRMATQMQATLNRTLDAVGDKQADDWQDVAIRLWSDKVERMIQLQFMTPIMQDKLSTKLIEIDENGCETQK